MNLQELSKEMPIQSDVFRVVEKVEELTGKVIEFHLVDDLFSHAMLKAARDFMPEHIVYLNKNKTKHLNHLITHECYHIFRFWSVDEKYRKIFTSTEESILKRKEFWKKQLGRKAERYPESIFELWNKGVMTLLYNAVKDSRIELAMYEEYPSLRDEQYASLKGLENEAKMSMGKQIQQTIPSSLFTVTNAMNYAFLTLLVPIVGKTWRKAYKGHSDILKMGTQLLKVVPDDDKGLLQDIEVIGYWSKILGLEGIQWGEFEDVPKMYPFVY